jgi:uncharacterized protein YbjT (DUF2867 family)
LHRYHLLLKLQLVLLGQHLVRKLKARDVDFTAGVRKEEQVEALKADGIDAT